MATLFILMSLMTLMGCHGDSMTLPLEDCRSMVPPDHGKLAQTTTAPYEISFSDKCYKTGLSLRVTLAGTNGSVFTSFLVQARKPNNDSFSYGTFSSAPGDDPEIDTIDCFNQSASAIGHYSETGYNFTRAAFNWTAPADVNIDVLEFVASVILDKETFWTGLSSPIARCNDNRDNSSLSENNEMTSESTDAAAQTTTTTTTETQPATTATTTTEIPPATTATTTTATEAPSATTATTTTTEIPPAATATMTTATEAPQATTATMTTATEASQATTETTAIGNFTIATDGTGNGTGYTWSTVAATATSTNESHTVAITTTSMNNQTTSGADRRKESMASLAFYVAFVASLALIHQQQQLAYL